MQSHCGFSARRRRIPAEGNSSRRTLIGKAAIVTACLCCWLSLRGQNLPALDDVDLPPKSQSTSPMDGGQQPATGGDEKASAPSEAKSDPKSDASRQATTGEKSAGDKNSDDKN